MPAFDTIGHLINGHAKSFQSLTLSVGSQIYSNISSISYSETNTVGKLKGTSPYSKARTKGEYEASGELEMYYDDAQSLMETLASLGGPTSDGYMQVPFVITVVSQVNPTRPLMTESLDGCFITEVSNDFSAGEDALTVKFKFDIGTITRDGGSLGVGNVGGAAANLVASIPGL